MNDRKIHHVDLFCLPVKRVFNFCRIYDFFIMQEGAGLTCSPVVISYIDFILCKVLEHDFQPFKFVCFNSELLLLTIQINKQIFQTKTFSPGVLHPHIHLECVVSILRGREESWIATQLILSPSLQRLPLHDTIRP